VEHRPSKRLAAAAGAWQCVIALTSLCVALGSARLEAQSAPAGGALSITGKINSAKGQSLLVDTDAGVVAVRLTEKTIIRGEVPITVSDIAPGMYVGATATKQPDGSFRMSRLHVFSEDQRGIGEGHRPLSSAPQSGATMTNANVEAIDDVLVQNVKERVLSLKYKGGELKVTVPPDIPVVKRELGDPSLLKRGAVVSVQATRALDDSLSASQITVRATGK
jgi:hypothetical protein